MLRKESPLRDFPWEENFRNKDKNVLLQYVVPKQGKDKRLVKSSYKNVNISIEPELGPKYTGQFPQCPISCQGGDEKSPSHQLKLFYAESVFL